MKRFLLCALLLGLLLWPAALHSQGRSQPGADPQDHFLSPSASAPRYRPGQVLVKFRAETTLQAQREALGALDLPVLEVLPDLRIERVAAPEGQEEMIVQALSKDPRVEYAELDYVVHASLIPNDPYFQQQWAPLKIQAPEAWDQTTGTSDVIIAIVDTGVDLNHPDLDDKIVPGRDFVNDDDLAQDDHGHGTHVAGIAAAETDNGRGVAGISWGARLMPVKVLDANGDGYWSDVARGIRYACNHGAQVINLSLGGDAPSSTLKDALEQAYKDGCLIVAAAGNSGRGEIDYPARYPEAIAVTATDRRDEPAGFSDYGPQAELAAPGVDIYSTLWTRPNHHDYGWNTGTSMSTPQVAGLAALIWSACPRLDNTEVRAILRSTAKDLGAVGCDSHYGYGRIDARKAVALARPAPVLTVDREQMVFLADDTVGPWPQTLVVGNGSPCGTLDWTAFEDTEWLETNPDAGQASASQPTQITVSVDKNGLSSGTTYNSTVTIESSTVGVQESPQQAAVKFVYSAQPLRRIMFPLAMHD
jgi:thermitase